MKQANNKIRNRKLKLLAWFLKTFKGQEITHAFYYSQKQKDLANSLLSSCGFPSLESIGTPLFKGKLYSEMRDINSGWCNWPDSRLVGLGSYCDITWPKKP